VIEPATGRDAVDMTAHNSSLVRHDEMTQQQHRDGRDRRCWLYRKRQLVESENVAACIMSVKLLRKSFRRNPELHFGTHIGYRYADLRIYFSLGTHLERGF